MISKGFFKILLIIGLLSMLHSAFSAAQHRSFLRLTEQQFHSIPMDIFVQCVLSLFLTVYSVLNVCGEFRDIRSQNEIESKRWQSVQNNASFYSFNHRGKFLSKFEAYN